MNAMTEVIVCAELIYQRLLADMKLVQRDTVRATSEEKIDALDALYKTHKYIAGEFSSSRGLSGGMELFFTGRICDVKYSIHLL